MAMLNNQTVIWVANAIVRRKPVALCPKLLLKGDCAARGFLTIKHLGP